jgi:predicted dehydrogenase
MSNNSGYGLSTQNPKNTIPVPQLDYLPPRPRHYQPRIGLIGAGGISEYHLRAYKTCNWDVVAICDRTIEKAIQRAAEFCPAARCTTSYKDLLQDPSIDVIDCTTHPEDRVFIIEEALLAGKHVLSQKPFTLDLAEGQRLLQMARSRGLRLAVNQNGRWAPHFSAMQAAVKAGLIGQVGTLDCTLHWDHTWTAGTHFENIPELILYDFGIHWFDIATLLMGGQLPVELHAIHSQLSYQRIRPPFAASIIAQYLSGAQVRLNFNAHVQHGQADRTVLAGSKGTLIAHGPSLNEQSLHLHTAEGQTEIPLQGSWFENGFQGSMGELLCAIEERREPSNSAQSALTSLQFCLGAVALVTPHAPAEPGLA